MNHKEVDDMYITGVVNSNYRNKLPGTVVVGRPRSVQKLCSRVMISMN